MFDLHHIGYLVKDLAASAGDFVARFGYVIESQPIEDAKQTAKVQFLRQPGATHWLELVSPVNERSKLYNSLQRGEGFHHFCYEVPDLEQAANHLREQEMLPLGKSQPATAFSGRQITWFMDRRGLLIELLAAGPGDFSLAELRQREGAKK